MMMSVDYLCMVEPEAAENQVAFYYHRSLILGKNTVSFSEVTLERLM